MESRFLDKFGRFARVLMPAGRIEMVAMKFGLPTLFTTLLVWSSAWADQDAPYRGMHMWGGGWHGWFFGPVMMILFLVIVVIVVVLAVRWLGGAGHGATHSPHAPSGKSPLDILRERFARGEIDREEFEERRRVLEE